MIRSLLPSIVALVVSGCASDVARVPDTVRVEVAARCVDPLKIPPRPQVRSVTDLMAMPRFQRTLAAWQDLRRWEVYADQLAALVAGCASLPPGG